MSQTCFSFIFAFLGSKSFQTLHLKLKKLRGGLGNKIGIHRSTFYNYFGQQKVKTPVYEIGLSLFSTIFGAAFVMITAQEELLFARTCA